MIVAFQPVELVLIGAIAYEEGQTMKAEASVVLVAPLHRLFTEIPVTAILPGVVHLS